MGLRIGLLTLIFPFICPFFLSFKAKFVSQFSPELCKLESSNVVYVCRMSDYIMGLRIRVMAIIYEINFMATVYFLRLISYILIDNDLLHRGIENQLSPVYSSIHLSILLSLYIFVEDISLTIYHRSSY